MNIGFRQLHHYIGRMGTRGQGDVPAARRVYHVFHLHSLQDGDLVPRLHRRPVFTYDLDYLSGLYCGEKSGKQLRKNR